MWSIPYPLVLLALNHFYVRGRFSPDRSLLPATPGSFPLAYGKGLQQKETSLAPGNGLGIHCRHCQDHLRMRSAWISATIRSVANSSKGGQCRLGTL
jgi:hypothetical protein